MNIPPGFSGTVDVSANASKSGNNIQPPSDDEKAKEAIELKLPNLDLDSADIFDILDIVMDTSIKTVPESSESSTIIRSNKAVCFLLTFEKVRVKLRIISKASIFPLIIYNNIRKYI